MATTLQKLRTLLRKRFGGVLESGGHEENGKACALELMSVYRGIPWTDKPQSVRSFDLRPLNDIAVSNEARTKHLLPVIAAYEGSLDWPVERLKRVVDRLVILTTQRIISDLPDTPKDLCEQCKSADTLEKCRSAVQVVHEAAARAADAYYIANAVSATIEFTHAIQSVLARDIKRPRSIIGRPLRRSRTRCAIYRNNYFSAANSVAASVDRSAAAAAYAHDVGVAVADHAAREKVFVTACKLWVEAARKGRTKRS